MSTLPPADPPRRADAVRNRHRALVAARELLTEIGPRVTVEDIARRAGLGAGTVVRSFGSKEALLDAAAADLLDPIVRRAREAVAADDVAGTFRGFLGELLAFVAEGRATGQQLEGLDLPATQARLQELRQAVAELVAQAQRAGAVRSDLDVATISDLISYVGHALGRRSGEGRFGPEIAVSFIMEGLQPPPARECAAR